MTMSVFLPVVSVLLGMPTSTGLLGLAAITGVLLVLLVVQVRGELDSAGSPIRVRAIALRERARHCAQLRLRDPDAAGHPRPRAPGFAPSAV